jgi:hypothetical protein
VFNLIFEPTSSKLSDQVFRTRAMTSIMNFSPATA